MSTKKTTATTVEESVVASAKQTKVKKTVTYVGPTILGVATNNTVYNNGLPIGLINAIKEVPAIGNLVVPVEKLSTALSDIQNKKGALYVFYEKALQYVPKKGEE